MARVLLAWELGSNYGHLVSLRALARLLRAAGHNCSFAARQLGYAHEFLEPELGPCFQSPVRLGTGRNPVKTQASYASLLHNTGFDDPAELAGRIQAWRVLYQTLKTEYLFAEHSPVALIAAKTLGIPACNVGTGFSVPPLVAPFPSFQPKMKVPERILQHNDAEVLKELNRALERLKLGPFDTLQEALRDARPALLTYRPLDHYDLPRQEPYLGMPDYAYGDAPVWPEGKGPKVFAYLRPGAYLPPVLDALKDSTARVLLRISGVLPARLKNYRRPGLQLIDRPVNFRLAAESCDAFLNYGAHGTVAEFLLAGKPG
ncbi:MAG: hypothetical protein L0Y32_02680, partial [Nevskiales bacterium]|nr:hypothetical protein [Nevskiales bacterium]